MSDQGNVSTEDTPPPRNAISVVTEENQASPAPDKTATPPVDDGKGQSSDAKATSNETQEDGDGKPPQKRNRRAERERRKMRKQLEEAENKGTALEAENLELRQRLDDIEAKLDAGPKPDKPKLADYTDPDKFAKDYAAWEEGNKPPARKAPAKKEPPPKKATTETEQPQEIVDLHKAGKARFGDEFAEVIGQDDLPISVNMIEYIFDSDVGPEFIMWAEDNREEAEKIYKMGPVRTVKAMDKIAATLEKGEDRSGTINVKDDDKDDDSDKDTSWKVTKAKEPPSDGVKTSSAATGKGLEGLSMEDYAARRRKAEREKRGL